MVAIRADPLQHSCERRCEEHAVLYRRGRLQPFVHHAERADGVSRRGDDVPHAGEAGRADQSCARRPWGRSSCLRDCAREYKAALDHLRAHGVEISFEEDWQGGAVNGPRAYFHDPDGTVLEFIDLTSYTGNRL
jgi:catechol 2,3-dioxygenase-like lactoylglutathione lyase family enzyme